MNRDIIMAAAALADPLGSVAVPAGLPRAGIAEVIALLRSNKVPLLGLEKSAGATAGAILSDDVWTQAAAEDRALHSSLAREVAVLSERFSAAGIEFVLFKSSGVLPYRSSNLDLLVRPERMADAMRILEEDGHLLIPHYREENKRLYRRFRTGRHAVCVHLHSAVSWGAVLIIDGDEVVDRAGPTDDGTFRIASAEDRVAITLAHSLYETDQIRLSDLRAVRLAGRNGSLDWDLVAQRAAARGWLAGLHAIVLIASAVEREFMGATTIPGSVVAGAGEALRGPSAGGVYVRRVRARLKDQALPPPFQLSKRHAKLQGWLAIAHRPDLAPGRSIAELFAIGWNLLANRYGLRCRPPAIIAVSGLDGSGKSTAVRALHEALLLCEVPVRIVWNRGGFSAPMARIKSAARAVMPRSVPDPGEDDAKRRWLSRRVAGTLFAAMVATEQILFWVIRGWIAHALGRTLVCDRFAWDTAVDLEVKMGAGHRSARLAGQIILAMAPTPDAAFLLQISPAEAARRKPGDVSLGRLTAGAPLLQSHAAAWGLTVIDAERSEDEVIGEVVDRGVRAALARFHRGEPRSEG